ncbi:Bifunctional epoxide hydrolase 2 [Penicillium ucsense]|uniref:Bifunctional epoxide hydrolase 2 n=1 Tax=Penicillium ucsense TaxID=2839758 RepID=A0A8J8W300_9EURO|nr:Bifunctional epoxide hydrolase 2 [Penicillium ucsense]KAF7737094.1 Bifunctional epoxide hydrolase 2 [Penicillium ucsense]
MAFIAFPQHAKSLDLSTGHHYNYIHIPARSQIKPTILFLHGFPSSSYDWRHQITHFQSSGYGIIAPDLLGYGGTSKPDAPEKYKAKLMTAEIIEILDHEHLTKVHGVAHDTGSLLLSRLANYHPERLLSCTFISVPYSKPGEHFDLDAINAMTKSVHGQEQFGYLKFFVRDDAGDIINQHVDSFIDILYPGDASLWNDHFGPLGALEAWLLADCRGPKAPYMTGDEREIHRQIMHGNYGSALKWYHALVNNLNVEDEKASELSAKLSVPVLMLAPAQSERENTAMDATVCEEAALFSAKNVGANGHWLQLEARDEVNSALLEFWESL